MRFVKPSNRLFKLAVDPLSTGASLAVDLHVFLPCSSTILGLLYLQTTLFSAPQLMQPCSYSTAVWRTLVTSPQRTVLPPNLWQRPKLCPAAESSHPQGFVSSPQTVNAAPRVQQWPGTARKDACHPRGQQLLEECFQKSGEHTLISQKIYLWFFFPNFFPIKS